MNIDKIPIQLLNEDPVSETYSLGTVEISKGEYANSEKINDLIEWCRELQDRLIKLEGK